MEHITIFFTNISKLYTIIKLQSRVIPWNWGFHEAWSQTGNPEGETTEDSQIHEN